MTLRKPINLILLLVLAVRSLLPAGFMVQAAHASDGGGLEIVICTSSGIKVLTADGDERPAQPAKPQHMDNGLCPYAAAGAAALAEAPPQPLVHVVRFAAVTYGLAAAQFSETPKSGAVSARGPPSHVI